MKEVLHRIGRDVWAYISCILVVVLAWNCVFGAITKIKTEEKVCVFIGSYSASFEKYEELNAGRPEYLRKIEVNAYSVNIGMFAGLLSVFGYETGDILILPEKYINEEHCISLYAEISEKYREQFENIGFYDFEGKAYGIKIHDKETHESLIDCIDFGEGENEENFYLLFNKKSLHLGDLSDENKRNDMDGAIKAAQRLLTL